MKRDRVFPLSLPGVLIEITVDDSCDLLGFHRAKLLRRIELHRVTVYAASPDPAAPTRFGEVGSFQAIGQKPRTGGTRKLPCCRKNPGSATIPGSVPLREKADRVAVLQMSEAGFHRVGPGRAFPPRDRLHQPAQHTRDKSLAKDMFTGHIIQREPGKAHGKQKRIPVCHMVSHDQAGSLDFRVLMFEAKDPTDRPAQQDIKEAPNSPVSFICIHFGSSFFINIVTALSC